MEKNGTLHEDLSRDESIRPGSDRAFGFVMAAALGAVGAISWWYGGAHRTWWLAAAAAFLLAALLAPRLLHVPNLLWLKFGLLLHRLVSPVILALMFFGVITPIGLLMRVLGKRPLELDFDARKESYWTRREPPGPARDSFPEQF